MKTANKIWTAVILMTMLCGLMAPAGVISLTTNGVNWSTNYYNPDVQIGGRYDGVPTNASPKWTRAGTMVAGSTLTDSYLRITTTGGKSEYCYTTNNWNLSADMTVEATLRVVSSSGTSAAGSVRYGNSSFYGTIVFNTNKIGTVSQNMTDWTTVRLVFTGMSSTNTATVKIYVNNNTNVFYTSTKWTAGTTLNQLSFGDPNSTSTDGTVDWESIRWTSGAYAPIPEPATIGMLGLGALITLVWRRKMDN